MKIALKKSGIITIFGALVTSALLIASAKTIAIISNATYRDKIYLLTQNAAMSGAALINTEGEAVAYTAAENILTNYEHTISITDCTPYKCMTITTTYPKLFSEESATYTVTAASYSDTNKVGSFLIP